MLLINKSLGDLQNTIIKMNYAIITCWELIPKPNVSTIVCQSTHYLIFEFISNMIVIASL